MTKVEHDLACINQSRPGKSNSDFSIYRAAFLHLGHEKPWTTERKCRTEEGKRGRSHERKKTILSQSLERRVDCVQKLLKQFFMWSQ